MWPTRYCTYVQHKRFSVSQNDNIVLLLAVQLSLAFHRIIFLTFWVVTSLSTVLKSVQNEEKETNIFPSLPAFSQHPALCPIAICKAIRIFGGCQESYCCPTVYDNTMCCIASYEIWGFQMWRFKYSEILKTSGTIQKFTQRNIPDNFNNNHNNNNNSNSNNNNDYNYIVSYFLNYGYRVSFPGVKRPGRGVDHSPHLC